MGMTSQLSPSKIEEMVKKAANKIVDDKLHGEDMLQELKKAILSACNWLKVTMRTS